MDIAKIRALVELVAETGVAELELETDDLSIRIRTAAAMAAPAPAAPAPLAATVAASPAAAAASVAAEPPPAPAAAGNLRDVTSPIVGTFYRAPEPGSPPFVEVGAQVAKGQTLCIIEAMKVMNEIEAEFAGTVREICVDDAQPVEAEGVLFRIEPA